MSEGTEPASKDGPLLHHSMAEGRAWQDAASY